MVPIILCEYRILLDVSRLRIVRKLTTNGTKSSAKFFGPTPEREFDSLSRNLNFLVKYIREFYHWNYCAIQVYSILRVVIFIKDHKQLFYREKET